MASRRYELKVCSACGAGNIAAAVRCYLCGDDLKTSPLLEVRAISAIDRIDYVWINAGMASLLAVMLLGLTLSAPPVGIALAVVLVPTFVVVVLVNPRKAAARIGVTVLIMTLVTALAAGAGFVALFLACAGHRGALWH